jgi:hypothetical protein
MKKCLIALGLALTMAAQVAAALDTADVLERATQELMDATAPGERAVWEHWTDAALTYVSEDNEVKDRAGLLADLQPLPVGSSGWITVEEFRCHDFGGFAITTYVLDEHETVEEQALHARYRASDTWRRTRAGWRVVAMQVYAIPQDPPADVSGRGALAEFAGVYSLSERTRQVLRVLAGRLLAERAGRAPQTLVRESGDVFFTPGRPRTRRVFQRGSDGAVQGFAERREGSDLTWRKLSAEVPAPSAAP